MKRPTVCRLAELRPGQVFRQAGTGTQGSLVRKERDVAAVQLVRGPQRREIRTWPASTLVVLERSA